MSSSTSDELFYLKWNNFQKNIRRMRDEEDLIDITFACEGKKIGAHKLVLFACSPYFKDLLKENTSTHPIFYMNDVKFDILKAILEYMYLGEVHITNDNLKDFIKTAESLQIRGLSKDTNTNEENLLTQENTTDSINLEEDFGRKRQNVDELGQLPVYASKKSRTIGAETSAQIIDDGEDDEEDDETIAEIQMPKSRKTDLLRTTHQTLHIIDQQNVEPKVEMLDYIEVTESQQKSQQNQLQPQQQTQQTQQQIQQHNAQNQQLQYCSLDSYTAATSDKTTNNRIITGTEQNTTQYIQAGTSQQQIAPDYKSEDEVWIDKSSMEIGSANTSQSETSSKSSKSKNSQNKANCLTPRSCPVCARVYSNVSNLRQHMRLIHNPTAVCCPICQKHFNSDLYLKRHYASIHAMNTTPTGGESSTDIENKNLSANNTTWTYATTNNDTNLIQQ